MFWTPRQGFIGGICNYLGTYSKYIEIIALGDLRKIDF